MTTDEELITLYKSLKKSDIDDDMAMMYNFGLKCGLRGATYSLRLEEGSSLGKEDEVAVRATVFEGYKLGKDIRASVQNRRQRTTGTGLRLGDEVIADDIPSS